MESSWKPLSIGDLGRVVTGRTPPGARQNYFGDSVPFLTPTDMDGRRKVDATARSLSPEGADLLQKVIVPRGIAVSCIGWQMGKAIFVDRPTATNQQINTIIPDSSLIIDLFLYYALTAKQTEIFALGAGGSRTPILNKTGFEKVKVDVPPLSEQRAIAHILGTLDDKIELNRRMNETLEAMARALFKSWFVDFDPVRAKADGRDPGLPEHIAGIFPDRFEDSELGEIPAGWSIGKLAKYADLNPESWSKRTAPDEILYVDLATTKWGKIEETQRYLWEDAPSRARRVLRPGDTIVGTVRPGNGSFCLIADEDLTGSTGFAVLRPRKPIYEELVYLSTTSAENIERMSHLADGAAYPAVRPDVVSDTQIVQPIEPVVEYFSQAAAPLMSKAAANRTEIRTLAAIRDALLPRLISGELRVPDAARSVEARL